MNMVSKSPSDRIRVIVLGYIVRGPLGGMAWHHLQYMMGLSRLGHDVYFVEVGDDYPSCYDPSRNIIDIDPSYGLRFIARTFKKIGLAERWTYYDQHTSRWLGPCADQIFKICAISDLLLNISGVNLLPPSFLKIPVRIFIDTDPVFVQTRHLTDSNARNLALQHNSFLSFGENINIKQSTIPDDGLPWQATRQPVVLEAWPVTPGPKHGKFTTVMQWDSYPAIEYEGCRYGMKSDSFSPYIDLPEKTGPILEMAIGSPSAPRTELCHKGWSLRDPLELTKDPWTYQKYIQQSRAEFSVAKHGYVVSRSGWFSERSAAYLASGRPVLTQETGFSEWLETGSGIIPFSTPEEALAGIGEISSRYEFHCHAARSVAEDYFDAYKVLPRLIDCAFSTSPN